MLASTPAVPGTPAVTAAPGDMGSGWGSTITIGRGAQTESSRAQWNGQTLIIVTTFHVDDRGAGKPFTVEVTRRLWLESPTTLIVEVTRAGVLGGPASTTRSV